MAKQEMYTNDQLNNLSSRIQYIDALKGFAILLVVMGHVLANCHMDYNSSLMGGQSMLLWKVIYSFHMPLFMFCSGLVFKFDSPSLSYFCKVLKKRFVSLMFPYFCMGTVSFLFRDVFSEYWYLYVLFVFYFVSLVFQCCLSRFKWNNGIVGSVVLLLFAFAVQMFCIRYKNFAVKPFFDLSHFSLYFWFCLGYVFKKHKMARFCHENIFSVFALIFFLFFFLKFHNVSLIHIPGHIYVLSAILFFYSFFVLLKNNKFLDYLSGIGFYSLEIYLIHFFFLLKLPFMENFLNTFDVNSSVIIQLFISLLFSLLIIACCIFITKVIPSSPLKQGFLGRK